MRLATHLVLTSLTAVEEAGLRPRSRSGSFPVGALGAQTRPAAVPGHTGGPWGPGRGQRPSWNLQGPPGAWTRPAAILGLTGAPRGLDEASGLPGTNRGPPGLGRGQRPSWDLQGPPGAWTRPAAFLGLSGGPGAWTRPALSQDAQVPGGLGRAPGRGRAAPRKRGLGEAVATSPGCPGRLRCPEQGLGSAPGWVGRPPVGARAWCSRAQHCTQGRACVQPLLTSSLVPGDAGGGVPVSPSFCPGRTSQKSSCECPRGLAWLGRCPQDPQCLDPPAACESTGPFP